MAAVVCGITASVVLLLASASAQAATSIYPAGGSGFAGGSEGWAVKSATCTVPVICTASGGYDGVNGNPVGSLAANANITLNLLSLFKATVVEQSPEFKVGESGPSTIRVDRQFAPASLVDLAPQSKYTVALVDLTAGTEQKAIAETIGAASGFTRKEAAVDTVAGHTYLVAITTETSSTLLGTGLLAGNTSTRFDNVALTVQTPGGEGGPSNGNDGNNGGDGGNGANGLSSSQLLSLLRSDTGGTAILKGKRLYVKGVCPAKAGTTCSLSLQGLLSKRKAATTKRTSKVAKGKAKTLVLKVKPTARKKLAKSSRLLFRETVHAGSAKATVYKRLKLIRRR